MVTFQILLLVIKMKQIKWCFSSFQVSVTEVFQLSYFISSIIPVGDNSAVLVSLLKSNFKKGAKLDLMYINLCSFKDPLTTQNTQFIFNPTKLLCAL